MKMSSGIFAISVAAVLCLASADVLTPCVEGSFTMNLKNGCNYEKFHGAYEGIFNEMINSPCEHSLDEDMRLILNLSVTADVTEVKAAIREVCKVAWDKVEKVPFKDTHRMGDEFHALFYNGGTKWNEEVETKLETGESTNVLKIDASQVRIFYDSLAQNAHVEWPGELVNFDLDTCEAHAAKCCWPKDRQAGDGNGNCATPYDTNCYDKDPADNTDLCLVDLSRSPMANKYNGNGHINFPLDNADGEGAIHCHGFAWADDEYDYTSRYKANNLFYVSMYDHMHQRGYVRNIPGAPMCACLEQMPTVSRSDCTQIDVDETYEIVYNFITKTFSAELTDVEIDFNECRGRYNRRNNLHAYVARLAQEGKMTNDQRAAVDKYLVGDNRCDEVTTYEMGKKGYVPGFNHDENTWRKVAGSGVIWGEILGREGFRKLYDGSEHKIVLRVCTDCKPTHQFIYYKRITEVPLEMDLIEMLLDKWERIEGNIEEDDFALYSTLEDAIGGKNPWNHYDFNGSRGFPDESGPSGKERNQWRSFRNDHGRQNVAFYVMTNDNTFGTLSADGPSSVTIGNMKHQFLGNAMEDDRMYYITSAGNSLFRSSDIFQFVQETVSYDDATIIARVTSLHEKNVWTKGGIMIRGSLETNAPFAFCILTGSHGVYNQWRSDVGTNTKGSPSTASLIKAPVWLKLEKRGNAFNCFMSDDGEEWVRYGSDMTVALENDTYHAGMSLTSHNEGLLAEMVIEAYEVEGYFYPSAAPTVSKSPNYVLASIQTIEMSELEGHVSGLTNIATGKSARQSSSSHGGVASNAVDGNTDQTWSNGSVTHTSEENDAYWEVDLGVEIEVEYIAIYNRQDCCAHRLNNFVVELLTTGSSGNSEVVDSVEHAEVAGSVSLVHFGSGQRGSKVRIQLNGSGILSLAEVEVYG